MVLMEPSTCYIQVRLHLERFNHKRIGCPATGCPLPRDTLTPNSSANYGSGANGPQNGNGAPNNNQNQITSEHTVIKGGLTGKYNGILLVLIVIYFR